MTLIILILVAVALGGGLINFVIPDEKSGGPGFKLSLVFAGSYLFSITIIHLIPDLYQSGMNTLLIGASILLGFFLQQVLEYFSSGIEHGHLHVKSDAHHHRTSSAFTVLFALSIHAFMEGTILSTSLLAGQKSNAMLLGIIFHKIPAAFALMSVLLCYLKKHQALPLLLVFAIATPLGLWMSTEGVQNEWISPKALAILFALVSGSFLHISTTIVFESSPTHTFNFKKLLVGVAGALSAVVFEIFG